MIPSVSNMDKKVDTVPQVEQVAPPARPRRRGVWVAVGLVLAALILGGAVLGAVFIHSSQRHGETYDMGLAYRQRIVNQHVTINNERRIIYVKEERVGSLGGLSYLHNFDKRLTAIRDEVNRKCYLTSIQGTFEELAGGYRNLNGTSSAVQARRYQFMVQPIDMETLRTIAGEEIAQLCRDVPTHWIHAEATGECSSDPATNTTVAFRCGEGGVLDPVTMTCMSSGGQGQRFKRASLSMELAENCCPCCCCCCGGHTSG